MSKYTRIPQNTFNGLQMDAGILVKTFDPTGATEIADADIITATTGGIHITVEPEYSDMGEDVDNCPNNMKELKHLDSWTVTIETTALSADEDVLLLALGAADVNTDTHKITPRRTLNQSDFTDLWWVGDKTNGGFVAAHLLNALSTGGLDLQTTKNGKGQIGLTLTGHVSINAQDVMPIEFYSIDGEGNATPYVMLNKHAATIKVNGNVTLTADTLPDDATVTWSSSDTAKATVSGGVVTGVAEGNSIITASITVDGVTYTDTCTVIVEATA